MIRSAFRFLHNIYKLYPYIFYSPVCLEEFRLWDRLVPISPAHNETKDAQLTSHCNVHNMCEGGNSCDNATCVTPLQCVDIWQAYTCR